MILFWRSIGIFGEHVIYLLNRHELKECADKAHIPNLSLLGWQYLF